MNRLVRTVVATALGVASLALVAGPARAASVEGPSPVQLVSQTPSILAKGTFQIRISVNAIDPATDRLQILGYSQVRTRTNFASAAQGRVNAYAPYSPAIALSALPPDSTPGVYDVDIPVDQPAPSGSPVGTFSAGASGVYPIQLSVTSANGVSEGPPLTLFLSYATASDAKTVAPMAVSVIVPFQSNLVVTPTGRLAPLGPDESQRLDALARVLKVDTAVPAGILASPATIDSIAAGAAAGSLTDRDTLSNLETTSRGGLVELLPSTYMPVSLGDLSVAGLGAEGDRQLSAGTAALTSAFDAPPTQAVWAVNGPLDGASLGAMVAHHATAVITPDGVMTPAPTNTNGFTFARPTTLESGSNRVSAFGADPGITADFAARGSPVAAANLVLAELTMIQSETPGLLRGVVVMPPPGWMASAAFYSTLLAGLQGDPLVRAVTPSALFQTVPVAKVTRQLTDAASGTSAAALALLNDSKSISAARRAVNDLSGLLPNEGPTTVAMAGQLLIAESETLDEATRISLLGAISAAARKATKQIVLPPSSSITLTSTKGQIPITILLANPAARPRVQLTLTSQRLIFKPLEVPGGSCAIPESSKEICTFTLETQNTTLKVPVETRSSGVFPLQIYLSSPDGLLPLGSDQDTVRSTAVSGVGAVLIVVAVLSLAIWWARDLRHGRRSRRLAPVDEPIEVDPVVRQFFSSAPPPIGDREPHPF